MPLAQPEFREVYDAAFSLAPDVSSAYEYASYVHRQITTTRLERFRHLLDYARKNSAKRTRWWQSLFNPISTHTQAETPWEAALRECSWTAREVLVIADAGFIPAEAAALLGIPESRLQEAYDNAQDELQRHLWNLSSDIYATPQTAR
ncbi:MAG: hypothetical protein ABI811_22600 [Acidobacteriota bacterium]